MSPRDKGTLLDIFQAATEVQSFVKGVTEHDFLKSVLIRNAVLRSLEVMGEAARRLSMTFRTSCPTIEWRKIIGLRNILIHAYDKVNLNAIWEMTQTSIPKLIAELRAIPNLNPDEEIE
jgi:uncharacterized protein with HEPN domain